MQVRHVKDLIHIDFAVDNKNFNATVDKMEAGKLMESLLISNILTAKQVFCLMWQYSKTYGNNQNYTIN
jgi:hypothetical protein